MIFRNTLNTLCVCLWHKYLNAHKAHRLPTMTTPAMATANESMYTLLELVPQRNICLPCTGVLVSVTLASKRLVKIVILSDIFTWEAVSRHRHRYTSFELEIHFSSCCAGKYIIFVIIYNIWFCIVEYVWCSQAPQCIGGGCVCIRQSSFWPRRTDYFIPWPTLMRRTAREKPILIYSDCKRCHFIIYMTSIPDVLFMSWLNRYAAIRRVTHMRCNLTEMETHRSQSCAPLNCIFIEQQRTMSPTKCTAYEKKRFSNE